MENGEWANGKEWILNGIQWRRQCLSLHKCHAIIPSKSIQRENQFWHIKMVAMDENRQKKAGIKINSGTSMSMAIEL
jgi:hypothetical protein